MSLAPCAFVSVLGAQGIVRRHRHCAVAVRSTLSLKKDDAHRVPALSPWMWTDRLPETQLSTCGVVVVQTCRAVGTRPSVAPCVRGAIGRTLWPTPHLCAVPTMFFTSTCGVEHDQIPDQTHRAPTITSQTHVTKNVMSRSLAVPHRARLLLHSHRLLKID